MQQPRNASPRRPEQSTSTRRSVAAPPARRAHVAPAAPRASVVTAAEAAFRRALGETLPGWVFAPLRLFLAITFIYAGVQKFTDPQFFNPHAIGYIGKQVQRFAVGSPIHGLLVNIVAPHAQFWGGVVAWGEIAIGLGVLVGLLLRPAAFFGLLLSLMFFFSASWHVYPYFYGADIVFVFAWITMLLAGPLAGGWPSLDLWLAEWIERRAPAERRPQVAPVLALVLGTPVAASHEEAASAEPIAVAQPVALRGRGATRAAQRGRYLQAEVGRRQFVRGAVVGGGVMLVVSWLWGITHPAAPASTGASTGTTGATGATGSTSTGSTSAGASNQIALVKNVPANSSADFTIPSNGDPGVLVHLNDGKFVAFDATCTHAGCPVSYDPSSQLLLCPCHGAAFDPAKDAEVVQGPAPTPLAPVNVTVDQSTGAVMLN